MKAFRFAGLLLALMPLAHAQVITPSGFHTSTVLPPKNITGPFNTGWVATWPNLPSVSKGTVWATISGFSGTASGCSFVVYWGTQTFTQPAQVGVPTNFVDNTASITYTITASGTTGFFVTGDAFRPSTAIDIRFACTTYASTGTVLFEYIPDSSFGQYNYTHLTSNSSFINSSNPSLLHTVVIGNAGSSETITIYDNSVCSGNVISVITPVAGSTYTFDVSTQNGLCVTTAGTTAGDTTVTWR